MNILKSMESFIRTKWYHLTKRKKEKRNPKFKFTLRATRSHRYRCSIAGQTYDRKGLTPSTRTNWKISRLLPLNEKKHGWSHDWTPYSRLFLFHPCESIKSFRDEQNGSKTKKEPNGISRSPARSKYTGVYALWNARRPRSFCRVTTRRLLLLFPPPVLDVRELNVFWLELRRFRPCCTKSSYDSPVKRSFVARNCSRRTFPNPVNFAKCAFETRQLVYGNEPSFHSLAPTHRLATMSFHCSSGVSLSLSRTFELSPTLRRIVSLSAQPSNLFSSLFTSTSPDIFLSRENYEQLDKIHRSIVLEASATIKGIECSRCVFHNAWNESWWITTGVLTNGERRPGIRYKSAGGAIYLRSPAGLSSAWCT